MTTKSWVISVFKFFIFRKAKSGLQKKPCLFASVFHNSFLFLCFFSLSLTCMLLRKKIRENFRISFMDAFVLLRVNSVCLENTISM